VVPRALQPRRTLSDDDVVLAVDIGGTKMAAALVDRRGTLDRAHRVPTPGDAGPEALWSTLADLVGEVVGGDRRLLAGCGVGVGGPMGPGGDDVSPLNIPGWRRFPLKQRLAALTGLGVAVDNDAKALALAEGWLGAAVGVPDYVAMVVSTGIGGGIVLDNRLLDGRLGNAGHIGHVVVEPDGRPCACGGRGCLEAEASGQAIAKATGRPPVEASAEEIARCGTLVGRAVASVANLLDLSLAVVAGSVALGFGQPFFEAAQCEVRARAGLEFARGTRVVPAGLGRDGPLVGAAAVGFRWFDR
jgi:glucokinase